MITIISEKLSGRRTQFYIDGLYGVSFIIGIIYLMLTMNPIVAGFMGGLVLGYFLHVWEKMATYEKILKREVSEEAEKQVESKVDETVDKKVDETVDKKVNEKVDEKADETVKEKAEETVKEKVDKELEEKVEEKLEDKVEEKVRDGV